MPLQPQVDLEDHAFLDKEERALARQAFNSSKGLNSHAVIRLALTSLGQYVGERELEGFCASVGYTEGHYMSLEMFCDLLEIFKAKHLRETADPNLETADAFVAVHDTEARQGARAGSSLDNTDQPSPEGKSILQDTLKSVCSDFGLSVNIQELLGKDADEPLPEPETEDGEVPSRCIDYEKFKGFLDALGQQQADQTAERAGTCSRWGLLAGKQAASSVLGRLGGKSPRKKSSTSNADNAGTARRTRSRSGGIRRKGNPDDPRLGPRVLLDSDWPVRRPLPTIPEINLAKEKLSNTSFAGMLFSHRKRGESSGYSQPPLTPKGMKPKTTLELLTEDTSGDLFNEISPRDREILLRLIDQHRSKSARRRKAPKRTSHKLRPVSAASTLSQGSEELGPLGPAKFILPGSPNSFPAPTLDMSDTTVQAIQASRMKTKRTTRLSSAPTYKTVITDLPFGKDLSNDPGPGWDSRLTIAPTAKPPSPRPLPRRPHSSAASLPRGRIRVRTRPAPFRADVDHGGLPAAIERDLKWYFSDTTVTSRRAAAEYEDCGWDVAEDQPEFVREEAGLNSFLEQPSSIMTLLSKSRSRPASSSGFHSSTYSTRISSTVSVK
eukprot:NODE_830_length_2055_cov_85.269669_g787_i0.p1 GENE.NODE_830_length_2055_cov_85.269669_g787_i0~~NODE_830_length_2055_cov_85.269669_g787_i0.p1  ORF type:complete len:609 (-),score=53.45 NODE_830_length_2055_cov_85.269669_g787_i0:128-1954(-)